MKTKQIKRLLKIGAKSLVEEVLMLVKDHETYSEFVRRTHGFSYRHRTVSKKLLYDSLNRLKKRGWLEEKKIQDQIYYTITKEGRIKNLLLNLKLATRSRSSKATVIMFDIPEAKRIFRDFLRRLLLQTGFIMVQRSVFITPNVVPREFYDLLKELKLIEYIQVIEGEIQHP